MPQFHETRMGQMFFEGVMPRIATALEKMATAMAAQTPKPPPEPEKKEEEPLMSPDPDKNWKNDNIQFARLLAEIHAVCPLTPGQTARVSESMGLSFAHVTELFKRADARWEQYKEAVVVLEDRA